MSIRELTEAEIDMVSGGKRVHVLEQNAGIAPWALPCARCCT